MFPYIIYSDYSKLDNLALALADSDLIIVRILEYVILIWECVCKHGLDSHAPPWKVCNIPYFSYFILIFPLGQVGGHEGVGEVVQLGEGVKAPAIGSRVGIKWLADVCNVCCMQ